MFELFKFKECVKYFFPVNASKFISKTIVGKFKKSKGGCLKTVFNNV